MFRAQCRYFGNGERPILKKYLQQKLSVSFVYKRVAQGGLWHGSRTEKIENHGSRSLNFVFPNHENKQERYWF